MTLSDNDKQEIIQYVNDNLDGESTCDDEGDDMIIFTFDREQDEQPLVGTETILELLKQGFFVLYAGLNDDGDMQVSISDGDAYRH
jgi:hypothetical protein|tara:strand:+ start:1120 stop:1377 length:258 start_codon:yes stop_codon:yes gene_type:complete